MLLTSAGQLWAPYANSSCILMGKQVPDMHMLHFQTLWFHSVATSSKYIVSALSREEASRGA